MLSDSAFKIFNISWGLVGGGLKNKNRPEIWIFFTFCIFSQVFVSKIVVLFLLPKLEGVKILRLRAGKQIIVTYLKSDRSATKDFKDVEEINKFKILYKRKRNKGK